MPIIARAKPLAEIAHKFYQPHSLRTLNSNGPGPHERAAGGEQVCRNTNGPTCVGVNSVH
jgi:hypothetical protein